MKKTDFFSRIINFIISCFIITTILFTINCGSGGGSKGGSKVIIVARFADVHAASGIKAAASTLANIRYSVSGTGMETMTGLVPVVGNVVEFTLMVPNGPQRHFIIEALDTSNNVQYRGSSFKDLEGQAVVVEIILRPTIVGTWAYVDLDHHNDGTWESTEGTIIFDHDGTGINTFQSNDEGEITNKTKSFTYSIVDKFDGSIELEITSDGETEKNSFILSDNGDMLIFNSNPENTEQGITVAIRMDTLKTYTNADLNGDYYQIGYAYDKDILFYSGFYNSFSTIHSFYGNGDFLRLRAMNSDGVVVTDSVFGQYSVNPDGSFVFGGNNFNGYIGISGLFITSHPTVNNHWRISLGMKREDRQYSTADLSGTWGFAGFSDENNGNSFNASFGMMTCDLKGNCTISLEKQKDGILRYETSNHIFSVETDGSFGFSEFTIAPFYSSAIGNNGNTIFVNWSFGQSDISNREILIGVRCSNCSNLIN